MGRQDRLFDGYVFVTPSIIMHLRALKNAIDFLFREWNDKAAGFVSYGAPAGARGRAVAPGAGEVHIATVRNQVLLSMLPTLRTTASSSGCTSREVCQCNVRPGHRLGAR